jgi:hypothetical protein
VRQISSITTRCTELGRRSTSGCCQTAKCFIATSGAFEDFVGDAPTNPVVLSADGEALTRPFKGDFHIG